MRVSFNPWLGRIQTNHLLIPSNKKQLKKVFCKQIDLEEFYEAKILIDKFLFEEGISVDPDHEKSQKLDSAIQTILKEKFGVNCEWDSFDFKKEKNNYAELFVTFKKRRTILKN